MAEKTMKIGRNQGNQLRQDRRDNAKKDAETAVELAGMSENRRAAIRMEVELERASGAIGHAIETGSPLQLVTVVSACE